MADIPFGLIAGIILLAGFAIWGFFVFRSNRSERGSETSSHHESGIGQQNVGPPPDSSP